jgi:hypothetical protein
MKKVGDGIYPPEKQLWLGLDSETVSITPSVRDARRFILLTAQ